MSGSITRSAASGAPGGPARSILRHTQVAVYEVVV